MKNAALTVTTHKGRVMIIVEGADGDVTLAMTPTDAREIAAKLLKEAHTVDVDADLAPLFVRQVGEA